MTWRPTTERLAIEQLLPAEYLQPRIVELAHEIDVLRAALREVRELLDNFVDIIDSREPGGPPLPNDAMRAQQLIDEMLR